VRFRYLSSAGRTSGAGSVSPIFFLHGYPTWAEVWLPLAAALGPRRPWIAPDLPDHNRSGPLPENDRSVSAYRRAVTALFDALQLPRAIVVGERERVRAPTLVVWGRQDPQFDWQIGEAGARRIPQGQFVAIEDCGHFPMVEKPTETAAAVSAFLGP